MSVDPWPSSQEGCGTGGHLPVQLRANPDLALEEHRELWQAARGRITDAELDSFLAAVE